MPLTYDLMANMAAPRIIKFAKVRSKFPGGFIRLIMVTDDKPELSGRCV